MMRECERIFAWHSFSFRLSYSDKIVQGIYTDELPGYVTVVAALVVHKD